MCKAWLCDGKKELSTFHHDGGIVTYHDGGRGFEEIDYSDRVVGLVDAELTTRLLALLEHDGWPVVGIMRYRGDMARRWRQLMTAARLAVKEEELVEVY